MTVNRAPVIRVKRELLPVLWVQLKAVHSTSWCRLVLIREKGQKLIIFIVKYCNWLPCAHSACRQAKQKYYFNYLHFFTGDVLVLRPKKFFLSLLLHADSLFPKAVQGKSSYPHDCYLLRSKALQTWNIFSSVTANLV